MFRFNRDTKTWSKEGLYTAQMSWTTAPDGYPSSGDYLEGDVKNDTGTVVGRLSMGWVSKYLRRATVEIDRVSASEAPLNNGAGVTWRSIFEEVGWDLNVIESHTNVTEPSGEGWSMAELHQGMLAWRDSADLDREWRYHLMCVRQLDYTSRGVMFDAYGYDANNVPREGAAISSHWEFPDIDRWDLCRGMRFGSATAPYFRTAVHEIGHAIMMFHPSAWGVNHIMQVTPQIADNATPPVQFPDNIEWSFSTEDQRRLRHLPDVVVRPGSVLAFGSDVGSSYTGVPLSPLDVTLYTEGLDVEVTPLLEAVPLGAPVRVHFQLINKGVDSVSVPARLGMKSGNISGKVVDPAGNVRTFATIVRYLDEDEQKLLEPDQALNDSLTLLRGPQGPLFASPGVHRIIVTISWHLDGCPIRLAGETSIMVTPTENEEHAKAALKILANPDALVTLVVGGDHVTDGVEAIAAAVKDPVLKPHYAYIEAKRFSQKFGKRKANLEKAAELITDAAVMSPAEIRKAAKWIKDDKGKSAARGTSPKR